MRFSTAFYVAALASVAFAQGNNRNGGNQNNNGGNQNNNGGNQNGGNQNNDGGNQNDGGANNGGNNNNNNNGGNEGGNAALALDPDVVQTGSQADGGNGGVANEGQSLSQTSQNNFINFCAGKTLTNGLQVEGGSCNGIPMGEIPGRGNMISAIITNPESGGNIEADTTFDISVQVSNLVAGSFTNAQETYYSAPQALQGGNIVGHTHVTVQDMGNNLNPTQPLDPSVFAFFKGINDDGNGNGLLSATVTGGLPAGNYRVCSMTSASNHQPVLMPVAQRGAQDDCTKFTVGAAGNGNNDGGNNAGNGNNNNNNNNAGDNAGNADNQNGDNQNAGDNAGNADNQNGGNQNAGDNAGDNAGNADNQNGDNQNAGDNAGNADNQNGGNQNGGNAENGNGANAGNGNDAAASSTAAADEAAPTSTEAAASTTAADAAATSAPAAGGNQNGGGRGGGRGGRGGRGGNNGGRGRFGRARAKRARSFIV